MQRDNSYRLVFASASPARRALLKATGSDVLVSGVAESAVKADDAYSMTLALARLKARTVAARMPAEPGVLVLGCDSVLAFDGSGSAGHHVPAARPLSAATLRDPAVRR